MTCKLNEVATVRSGLVLSRREVKEGNYHYRLLNLKAFNDDGLLAPIDDLPWFHTEEELADNYLTKIGDIIIRLTSPFSAVLITPEYQGLVVSSNCVIIRTNSEKLLPEYLHWLLNSPTTRRAFQENITGNVLGTIKASYFANMEIKLLPVAEQRLLGEFNGLAKRESLLLRELAAEKERYHALLLQQAQQQMSLE